MLSGQRSERASVTPNDVPAISLNASDSAELLIHELSGRGDPCSEISGQALAARQLFREVPPRPSQQRDDVVAWQVLRECANELRQQRDVRTGQQLLHLWCQLEHMKRPGCPRPLADTADHSIALQHRQLRSHAIRREIELSRKVFDGQRTAPKQCDEAPASAIEKLLFQHASAFTLSNPLLFP